MHQPCSSLEMTTDQRRSYLLRRIELAVAQGSLEKRLLGLLIDFEQKSTMNVSGREIGLGLDETISSGSQSEKTTANEIKRTTYSL